MSKACQRVCHNNNLRLMQQAGFFFFGMLSWQFKVVKRKKEKNKKIKLMHMHTLNTPDKTQSILCIVIDLSRRTIALGVSLHIHTSKI